jgi:N-acetylglucosamine-6-phosphate deacetylase
MERDLLNSQDIVFTNGRIASGGGFVEGSDLVVRGGVISALVEEGKGPKDGTQIDLAGADLVPGFIDLQVNGGGGVIFNDDPSVDALVTISQAHTRCGTTGFLPTLISDSLDKVRSAIGAVEAAIAAGVPGILGIHLEGPFLNVARKGIHNGNTFRVLDEAAIALLTSLRTGKTLITLAPETAPKGAIAALVARGAIVFAGHSDATYEHMVTAQGEGLSGVTHLFNAMSQIGPRAPGVVGAALTSGSLYAGLIADGAHVHPANMALAAASLGPDRLILVSDAMGTMGAASAHIDWGGHAINARGDTCYTKDGALAGSNLHLARAVTLMSSLTPVTRSDAVRMASAAPAAALGLAQYHGSFAPGRRADLVAMTHAGAVTGVWGGGGAAIAFILLRPCA